MIGRNMLRSSELVEAFKRRRFYDDLRLPAQALQTGAIGPTWNTTYLGWEFDDSPAMSNEEIQATAQMPHKWAEGTDISVHIHWTLTVNGAANEDVKWDLLYRWANVGGNFGAGFTTLQNTVDVSASSQYDHLFSAWADISMTGGLISAMLDLRVQRDTADAADDHPNPVILKEVDIHYLIDSIGSYERGAKWG